MMTPGGLIRAIVKDFPPFRTAAKPNEWEQGYHCVIDTLWHIALTNLINLKNKKINEVFILFSE